jgi:hypothetical protein
VNFSIRKRSAEVKIREVSEICMYNEENIEKTEKQEGQIIKGDFGFLYG